MHDPSKLRIPLATFKRVFDVQPAREVVTLPQLIARLTCFELKPEVQRRVDRELERATAAREHLLAGRPRSGRFAASLAAARDDARRQGDDEREAIESAHARLCGELRRKVKQDLKLWSPALFTEGARRKKEDVTHVSCLVMDHDDGTPIEVVREVWSPWFHIVHTTWSHRLDHPRFRIVLPLSQAVEATRWEKVYAWAIERSEGVVDPTGRGIATTFALPALGSGHQAREAYSHAGALLDPVAEGLIDANEPPSDLELDAISRPSSGFLRDPDESYIGAEEVYVEPPLEEQALWDAVAGPVSTPPSTIPIHPAREQLERWMERVAPSALAVDALERLEGLRDRGALTVEEFEVAKAAVLADLRVQRSNETG